MNRRGVLSHWLRTASLPRDTTLAALGILGGWAVAQVYYIKSLESVRADVAELKRMHQLTLRGIESIGTIRYARDSGGDVTGVGILLKGSATAGAAASGTL